MKIEISYDFSYLTMSKYNYRKRFADLLLPGNIKMKIEVPDNSPFQSRKVKVQLSPIVPFRPSQSKTIHCLEREIERLPKVIDCRKEQTDFFPNPNHPGQILETKYVKGLTYMYATDPFTGKRYTCMSNSGKSDLDGKMELLRDRLHIQGSNGNESNGDAVDLGPNYHYSWTGLDDTASDLEYGEYDVNDVFHQEDPPFLF